MSDAILALRKAVHARLVADAALVTLLGGARIHDEPPRSASGVYAIFGDAEALDWSTSSDRGCEQTFRLVVWAAETGSAVRALEAGARIEALLHDASLTLTGHRLINLRSTDSTMAREPKTNLQKLTLVFRAVTEMV
jgi:Protein of unknown function (DUF3168)